MENVKTIIWAWSVLYGRGEYPSLTEECSDKEGGAGGVRVGGQEVGEPGGYSEHCGGHKIVVNIPFIFTLKIDSDSNDRIVTFNWFSNWEKVPIEVAYFNIVAICPLWFFVK